MKNLVNQKVKKNFIWFKNHKDTFYHSINSKYVLIDNCCFIGNFETPEDALKYAAKEELKPGFIVQEIDDDKRVNDFGYYSAVIGKAKV